MKSDRSPFVLLISLVMVAMLGFSGHTIDGDILYQDSGLRENKVKANEGYYCYQPSIPGFALIAMSNCVTESGHLAIISSGGESGAIETWGGGIFLNATETEASQCSIDPPSYNLSNGIVAHNGWHIASIGSVDYAGKPKIQPNPIDTGINLGIPIIDPISRLPEPACNDNGSIDTSVTPNVYYPGRYGGDGEPSIGDGNYMPGIYCITGDVNLSGEAGEGIIGDGVVLYFINGGLYFSGQAGLGITAPNSTNCLDPEGNPLPSCMYKGMAVFLSRSNTSTFEVRGVGDDAIHGTVYGLRASVKAISGGVAPDEVRVVGQIIAARVIGNGSGPFKVLYNANDTYWNQPAMCLLLPLIFR